MKTEILSEDVFFRRHDELKAKGAYILRCVEIAGQGPRRYHLTYILT